MPPVRRLPVLQEPASPDDGRPAWHWTLIGTLFALSIWVPFAMLSSWMSGKVVRLLIGDEGPPDTLSDRVAALPPDTLSDRVAALPPATRASVWLAVTAMPVLSFAFACLAAGALVGRFGSRAGAKEAALGAALAGAVGASLSVLQAGWAFSLIGLVVLLPAGAASGWLGGRLGWRRRPLAERRSR